MIKRPDARSQDFSVSVTFLIHPEDVCYYIHAVFSPVIETAYKWRNKHVTLFCAPCRRIYGGSLFLAETEGHVYPHRLFDGLFSGR